MLGISQSAVRQIIAYGHELQRARPELEGLFETLSVDAHHALIAIMWIGRESFAPEDYEEALAVAQAEATTPTLEYLLGSPHFADHLEAGLEALSEMVPQDA